MFGENPSVCTADIVETSSIDVKDGQTDGRTHTWTDGRQKES